MSTKTNNIDFATEVKIDRLAILWKVTLVTAGVIAALVLTLMTFSSNDMARWVLAPLLIIAGCLLTRFFLRRNHYYRAAWSYLGGLIAGGGAALVSTNPVTYNSIPFFFVLIVFLSGLMLRPITAFVVAGISSILTIAIPWVITGSLLFFGGIQVFALVLIFLAAGLSIQAAGDLYMITEWALLNYQRERRTNTELFDNRQKLELSLKRSEALSDRLKTANDELEQARAAAEAAKNFRGQFLANMSHELRTPLNAIIGFSETMLKFPMMYDNIELPDAYRGDLDQIFNSGKQLLTLINDILDLAKVDAGKLEIHLDQVELTGLIKGAMATANGLIGEKPIKMRLELPEHLPYVLGDGNRIRQILLNLYSNAVKFTDQGEIVLHVRELSDGIQLSLRDTGCGIPSESLSVIFEEFKQADNQGRDPRSGAGLGLAISRQLVTMMGGSIWAESTVGVGSTFHFTLPRFSKPTTEAASMSAAVK
ncbi:MAG: HAMP domain-containing histidine kinase [Anaerolineae bacterium]|jgi:signal transduction histidine kinase|nr:HAMP domain-containing histidine kinase [Anaerolineae bacterium]